ncbi:YecA family protein [Salipaludibacillus aurantiacus]|uniref:SEC-C motif-containing protein n=1 Tax=Salipaludibacillus aurantiacus TaxID=1601833 RepID=A0A1H9UEJ4_9BACI|nr:SEC-C metal-binding domain-containing protein [Salipaludibacillus aurantiacus]SES07587.1 SEC-C motif-containing protein [Salipaludibacillus aurantiacus]
MARLTEYVIALTHLYGLVHKHKVVEIYNKHHESEAAAEDIEKLYDTPPDELTPQFVHTYKNHFVHEAIMEFGEFEDHLAQRKGKPYYIPNRTELLKYTDDMYLERTAPFYKLLTYLTSRYFKKDKEKAYELADEIQAICHAGFSTNTIFDTIAIYGVEFKDEKEVNKLVPLILDLANHTRLWENNGFTPHELSESSEKPNLMPLPLMKDSVSTAGPSEKAGRNDPCPCGSGKKYKKCCLN